jgi:hypothetical protein
LIDYSAGVPRGRAVREAGFVGAVRYVSDARDSWMKGKPVSRVEVEDFRASGLVMVSNYQYSKGGNTTSDWTVPADGADDARRALELHAAAGGPDKAPIYVSIDADPSRADYENLVRPYLKNWMSVLPANRLGVYCNGRVTQWLLDDGIGVYFWGHNWSNNWRHTDGSNVHPAWHIHQYEIDKFSVDGIKVDRNVILKDNFGQW